MATGTPLNPQQQLKIQLEGVQVVKRQAQDYVEQLTAYENDLRQRLMTGTPAPVSTPRKPGRPAAGTQIGNTVKGKKKGGLTPEGRKKLSDAARLRWENRRNASAEGTTTGATNDILPPAGMSDGVIQ